jgi:hypothetical protein
MTHAIPTHDTWIDPADRDRIAEVVAFIRSHDTATVLADMLPDLTGEEREVIGRHSRFAHAALLVFAGEVADVRQVAEACGLTVGAITPSVVVRDRLCRRYSRPHGSLEVDIVRAPVWSDDGRRREIEIFALALAPGAGLEAIVESERMHAHETHIALQIDEPDAVILAGLRTLLTGSGRMTPDGGGYNADEDATLLYFRNATRANPLHRRLELVVNGYHPWVLRSHAAQSPPARVVRLHRSATEFSPAKQLLQLMTGAWTTQAIAAAAELGIADRLAGEGATTGARLATLTGTDQDSLSRLLCFLASLGIVRRTQGKFHLAELGQPLRTDVEDSLRPLALLYCGLFYQSFGHLAHCVRTGQDAFEHLFGQHHFDYIAERPELADLFDRAMASSASMFDPIPTLVDFSDARVVVDIAGGNGELLSRILHSAPHLRGVLLERPHAIGAARGVLARAGCADRAELILGDFTCGIPHGGDVYILSRVLHDWDDQQCRALLKRCAEAMPAQAELLIVERLLPEDESPSLAVAWDIHMMCNVGGRERTVSQYRGLLAESGLEFIGQHPLPLDAALLRARPSGSRAGL